MSTAKIENVLQLIHRSTSTRTGFLPVRTPLRNLPEPYQRIVHACDSLADHYHGEDKSCRPWLESVFAEVPTNWVESLGALDSHELEALMTKTSLLCHAYRWKNMPASAQEYRIDSIELPRHLGALWQHVADRLQIPRVGNFYAMVGNNWKYPDLDENVPYDAADLDMEKIDLIHSWLEEPLHSELKAFIIAALGAEVQGVCVLEAIRTTYTGMLENKPEAVIRGLWATKASIMKLTALFNTTIKLSRIHPTNFLKYIQPTMIWLIDGLEGANGPQCCTIQSLDSFLGVERQTYIGIMITKTRNYLFPRHTELLEALDATSKSLRVFVENCDSHELASAYNDCLESLVAWRVSHRRRGARYLKGEANAPVEHYTSTGLVVKLDADREKAFNDVMQSHILETTKQMLKS